MRFPSEGTHNQEKNLNMDTNKTSMAFSLMKKAKALLPLGFFSLFDPMAIRMLVIGFIAIAVLVVVLFYVVVFFGLFSQKGNDRLIRLITAITSPDGSKDGHRTKEDQLIRPFTGIFSLWKKPSNTN